MSGRPFAVALCAGGFLLVGAALGIAVLVRGLAGLWEGDDASAFLANARGWAGALFVVGLAAAIGGAMLLKAASIRVRLPGTI